MTGQQKFVSLWVCLMLVAALCPAAHAKRKGNTSKGSPSQGRGLSKQGLKWAGVGAAAAGVLGGTGTGYGLGLFGRTKHGSTGQHKNQQDQRLHHEERQGLKNQTLSLWRGFIRAAAPPPSSLVSLGYVVSVLIAAWLRGI